MHLTIKKGEKEIGCIRFKQGPVYIGRQIGSQVFLPDKLVSRQHAVMYTDQRGRWILEDLGSANKTFLNDTAIHKSIVNDADVIMIGPFTIVFHLQDELNTVSHKVTSSIHLEDTVFEPTADIEVITRQFDHKNAPSVKLPAKRLNDLRRAANSIFAATNLRQLHDELVDIIHAQLSAMVAWAALKSDVSINFEIQGGRKINRIYVKESELIVPQHIAEAAEKHKYILIPQLPRQLAQGKVRSVMIAPVLGKEGCLGYLYANNTPEHEHFELSDLDYLAMLSILTATVIEKVLI